jgi:hypothetical protein
MATGRADESVRPLLYSLVDPTPPENRRQCLLILGLRRLGFAGLEDAAAAVLQER